MKKITLLAICLTFVGFFAADAQTITTVASGLMGPTGIYRDQFGNIFVAETGTGNNDGRVSMVEPNGMRYTVVHSLPSFTDTATHETSGPWRPYVVNDSVLWVVVGGGPDSSAGSLMKFSLVGMTPGIDSLTIADTMAIIHVQPFTQGLGYTESNIFSAVWDSVGNIIVADAGANALVKIDTSGTMSILDTFPVIPNTFLPSPPFPPTIDYVPTKIISNQNGEYYVCNLTGYPFINGLSSIVMVDDAGNVTPQISGLTQAVDMDIDSLQNLYILQFGTYDTSTMPVMNSASIIRIMPTGAIDTLAMGFGPSGGMSRDSSNGFYVTELMTGNLLHITDINNGIRNIANSISDLIAYPNPFSDKLKFNYTLNESSLVSYSVSDQIGNVVYNKSEGLLSKGSYSFEIDTKNFNSQNLATGIYRLTIYAGNSKKSISILKK